MRVLISGGTGSLGRALIQRFLSNDRIERVVSLSRDEVKAGELQDSIDDPRLRVFLGDVRDKERLLDAFVGIDTVVHAAALKRVQQSAYNPEELIKTNVMGTGNVVRAAAAREVKRVLFISSDKSVQATNLYGSTKHTAETYSVQANTYTYPRGTKVAAVRYGNVLASRGSVVPYWQSLALQGQELPITDTRMTRFWLTLSNACDLVEHALSAMKGGEVFVPILPSVRMVDVVIAIAGGPKFKAVGLRLGGEKLHELLLSEEEPTRTVELDGHYVVKPAHQSWAENEWHGRQLAQDFVYRSDLNHRFLSVEEIRNAISVPNS